MSVAKICCGDDPASMRSILMENSTRHMGVANLSSHWAVTIAASRLDTKYGKHRRKKVAIPLLATFIGKPGTH